MASVASEAVCALPGGDACSRGRPSFRPAHPKESMLSSPLKLVLLQMLVMIMLCLVEAPALRGIVFCVRAGREKKLFIAAVVSGDGGGGGRALAAVSPSGQNVSLTLLLLMKFTPMVLRYAQFRPPLTPPPALRFQSRTWIERRPRYSSATVSHIRGAWTDKGLR